MVNPDHTTASARARRGQDAAAQHGRGRGRGRAVVTGPVGEPDVPIVGDIEHGVMQDDVAATDVGQQSQGRPTAYPGGPDELSLLITYDQHEASYVWNNKVILIIMLFTIIC